MNMKYSQLYLLISSIFTAVAILALALVSPMASGILALCLSVLWLLTAISVHDV